jgi:hypothetical protein
MNLIFCALLAAVRAGDIPIQFEQASTANTRSQDGN